MAGWSKLIKNVSYEEHIHLSGLAHCHILVAGLNSSLVTSLKKKKKHTVKKKVTNKNLEPMEYYKRCAGQDQLYTKLLCKELKNVFSPWPCCIIVLNWFGKVGKV